MSAQPSRRAYHSPMPVCPDPYCQKEWNSTKSEAKRMRREVMEENGDRSPVRLLRTCRWVALNKANQQ